MSRCEDRSIDWQRFILNGGTQTLASYDSHEDEFENDRRWVASLPTSYEDELRIFVHAGIKPNQPLAEQTDATNCGRATSSSTSKAHSKICGAWAYAHVSSVFPGSGIA